MSSIHRVLSWLAATFAILAAASGILLLASNAPIHFAQRLSPALTSALPLLGVGLSFLLIQPIIRPRAAELLKNLILVGAFLLWGVVQLMTQKPSSKLLGDVVIALYVIELVWTVLAKLRTASKQSAST